MVVQTRELPPLGADFEIFRQVRVDGLATRVVAKVEKLSQNRVCQMVNKVDRFLLEVVPVIGSEEERKLLRQRALAVSEYVATARLEALYGRSLRAFEASLEKQVVTRVSGEGRGLPRTSTLTKQGTGDYRCLLAASRLTLLIAKYPPSQINIDLGACAEGLVEQALESYAARKDDAPPVRACSAVFAELGEGGGPEQQPDDVSTDSEVICDELPSIKAAQKKAEMRTVQSLGLGLFDDHDGLGEPSDDWQNAEGPLTKKQRKSRQRFLERRRRQAK